MKIKNITNDSFDKEVLKSKIPVIVDFYADWCGPCRMLRPILEELASKEKDYKIVSINVDEEDILSEKYGISSIPCLIVFKNGKEVKRCVGLRPKQDIEKMMEEI